MDMTPKKICGIGVFTYNQMSWPSPVNAFCSIEEMLLFARDLWKRETQIDRKDYKRVCGVTDW